MKYSHIVAVDQNMGIGYNDGLPWNNVADIMWFKEQTMGKVCIMGRHTFESIIRTLGKPLPMRRSVVITALDKPMPAYPTVDYTSPENALVLATKLAADIGCAEIMVVGGAATYEYFGEPDTVYMTYIAANHECDTYYPESVQQYLRAKCYVDNTIDLAGGVPVFIYKRITEE